MKKLLLLLYILGFFSSAFAKEKEGFNDFSEEILDVYSIVTAISQMNKNFNSEDLLIYEKALADAILINSSFYDKEDKKYSLMYTKKTKNGMTPLMLASLFGFPNIVQALLVTSDNPKRDLEMRDKNGLNAYELAGLAENQTYISCEFDKFLVNPESVLEKIRLRGFYLPNKDNSYLGNYKKILVSMEYYGMKFDNKKAKANFNKFCSISDFFVKKLDSSDDSFLFMTLLNEVIINDLLKDTKK